MNDRESLIARKQEVLRELTRARRQLEGVRQSRQPASAAATAAIGK